MLRDIQYRWIVANREAGIILLLTILAFSVRVHRVDFNSLSEDESAKWAAVQEYRHGHFAGVNSEHPMLPKMLAWASLTAGESWGRIGCDTQLAFPKARRLASLAQCNFRRSHNRHSVFVMSPNDGGSWVFGGELLLGNCAIANRVESTYEGGNATHLLYLAGVLFLLSRSSVGWRPGCKAMVRPKRNRLRLGPCFAVHSSPSRPERACLVYCRQNGDYSQPSRFNYKRFYLVLFISFILVNPVVLSPSNFHAILQWLHHDGVKHSGYDFDGTLYMKFPSRLFAGVPWFYYLWLCW